MSGGEWPILLLQWTGAVVIDLAPTGPQCQGSGHLDSLQEILQ